MLRWHCGMRAAQTCTMPYIATSWAIAVRTLRFERSLRRGRGA